MFITQVVQDRKPVFRDPQYMNLLHEILHNVRQLHPFTMFGYGFLLDHFHVIIQPTGESNFSDIMHSFKPHFTREFKKMMGLSSSEPLKFWQKRFWDHVIRDQNDLDRHIDYIHYNPVRHGYVKSPFDWPHSSIHRYFEEGFYQRDWGMREIVFAGEYGE